MNDIRRTTAEELAGLLRARIHRGELSPGDRLPAERDLAAQLGVARVTVRGALGALQQEGYLEVRRGATGGRFVTELAEPYGRWRTTMAADLGELTAVLEYRTALERQVAVLAAGRRTTAHLRRMRRAIEDLGAATTPEEFRRADDAFHTALGAAAKNHLLAAAVADARGRLFSPTDRLGFEAHVETSRAAHQAVFDAVAAGDADGAAAAIERHLSETAGELVEVLSPRAATARRPAGPRARR
ncbi:MAG: FCD domain-containing protein [Ilumatobacteraceae bacterium]|nr:FadR family transcriptional regulator [Ilumatobacter sp.]MCB0983949.1 FadR family transcriptional regulator [Ilumatobacter sp.]